MSRISYHVSHEQFSPRELLRYVRQAEAAGFDAAFSSDHLQPWAPSQGQSGFAWAWLGAALAQTERFSFSVITVPGGWRYHPAVLAQAIATLGQMFPGRLPWVAIGSGEAINERVVGLDWPEKGERNARLREAGEVMRALLHGETVTHRGRVCVLDGKIWSRPDVPTQLVGAAISESTAQWLGGWADGLLTTFSSFEGVKRVVDSFRRGGGQGKPIHLKVDLSWGRTQAEALKQAHEHWRFNILGGDAISELRRPEDFLHAARFVRPDDMRQSVLICNEPAQLLERISDCVEMGFETIDLHNVGANQSEFIDMFGSYLLPSLRA
jgi:probable non-F420 flavinoid oxidoreductase